MGTLAEIEAAADALPPSEKRELFLFLAMRLPSEGQLPLPREFTKEQIEAWISDDEGGMRRLLEKR
jgi:hypothetical protein